MKKRLHKMMPVMTLLLVCCLVFAPWTSVAAFAASAEEETENDVQAELEVELDDWQEFETGSVSEIEPEIEPKIETETGLEVEPEIKTEISLDAESELTEPEFEIVDEPETESLVETFIYTEPETVPHTFVEGVHIWNDKGNQDGLRGPITLYLYQFFGDAVYDAFMVDSMELDESKDQVYFIFDKNPDDPSLPLPAEAFGMPLGYIVVAGRNPEYDSMEIESYEYIREDGVSGYYYKFTESRKVNTTIVEGMKVWVDQDDAQKKRPEKITIELLADGEVIAKKTISAEDDWIYLFDTDDEGNPLNLNRPGKVGEPVEYTVREETVPGYTTTYTEDGITNTIITPIETTALDVTEGPMSNSNYYKSSAVQTGDETPITSMFIVMAISAVVIILLIIVTVVGKKKRK